MTSLTKPLGSDRLQINCESQDIEQRGEQEWRGNKGHPEKENEKWRREGYWQYKFDQLDDATKIKLTSGDVYGKKKMSDLFHSSL